MFNLDKFEFYRCIPDELCSRPFFVKINGAKHCVCYYFYINDNNIEINKLVFLDKNNNAIVKKLQPKIIVNLSGKFVRFLYHRKCIKTIINKINHGEI